MADQSPSFLRRLQPPSTWRGLQQLHWLLFVPPRGRLSQPTGQFSLKPPLEPVGGSAPKSPALISTLTPSMASALPFSLSCPAQGAPVPSYRPVKPFCLRASRWLVPQVLGTVKQLNPDYAFLPSILSLLSSTRVSRPCLQASLTIIPYMKSLSVVQLPSFLPSLPYPI